MKFRRKLFVFLHFFIGIGAMAGGTAAILNPEAPLGMSAAQVLSGSPFTSFLIPGIVLFCFIGLCNIAAGVLVLMRFRFQAYTSGFMACGLVGWIVIQCIILGSIHILHGIYFFLGVFQGLLSLCYLIEDDLFPAQYLARFVSRITK